PPGAELHPGLGQAQLPQKPFAGGDTLLPPSRPGKPLGRFGEALVQLGRRHLQAGGPGAQGQIQALAPGRPLGGKDGGPVPENGPAFPSPPGHQWWNRRMPVKAMAMLYLSQVAMTWSSRMEPPGWAMTVTPDLWARSMLSP